MTTQEIEFPKTLYSKVLARTNATVSILQEANVPSEHYDTAFPIVFAALANEVQHSNSDLASNSRDTHQLNLEEGNLTTPEETMIQRLSHETSVQVKALESVIFLEDGNVRIATPTKFLGSSRAQQARAVAQLITIANRVGLKRLTTSFDEIRTACQDRACYDPKNFASSHMKDIPGFVVRGDGPNRHLEARSDGINQLPGIIKSIQEAQGT